MKYDFSSSRARAFPPMVMFDITNVCNAACSHCAHPVIKQRPDYRATYLAPELHNQVIDEVRNYPDTALRYTADGEPLLHPKWPELLTYARTQCTNHISLTTNGERLNEERSRRLIEIGIDVIDVSLDAVDRAGYEKVRVGLDFDQVTGNVRALAAMRNAMESPTKIMVSIVRQPEVAADVERFVDTWSRVVDKVLVRELHTNVGMTFGKPAATPARHPCAYLWNRVVVGCTGVVKFCPIDWLHETDLQPIGQSTIADLWQGRIYTRLRNAHLAGDYDRPEVAACRPCGDWRITPWSHGYDAVILDLAGEREP